MNQWDTTYDKQWAVKDDSKALDFGQDEVARNNVVDGSYHVLLPDGRIQTVTYHVDKDSGYSASISYEQGTVPKLHHSYDAHPNPSPATSSEELDEIPAPSSELHETPAFTHHLPHDTHEQTSQGVPSAPPSHSPDGHHPQNTEAPQLDLRVDLRSDFGHA